MSTKGSRPPGAGGFDTLTGRYLSLLYPMKKERQRRIVALLTAECGKNANERKRKKRGVIVPFFSPFFSVACRGLPPPQPASRRPSLAFTRFLFPFRPPHDSFRQRPTLLARIVLAPVFSPCLFSATRFSISFFPLTLISIRPFSGLSRKRFIDPTRLALRRRAPSTERNLHGQRRRFRRPHRPPSLPAARALLHGPIKNTLPVFITAVS